MLFHLNMSTVRCRINVVDFAVEYVPSTPVNAEWTALSVCVQRTGMRDTRQLSRWMSATFPSTPQIVSIPTAVNGILHSRSSSAIDSLHTVNHNKASPPTAAGTLSKISWAACNLVSFVVDFRGTSNPLSAVKNYVKDPALPPDSVAHKLCMVHPKTNHQIQVSVVARRRGKDSESSPANAEPLSWNDDFQVVEFINSISIDPAEAFNSPEGQLEYRFAVSDQSASNARNRQNGDAPGTPKFVVFTVVAERGIVNPVRLLRNYHDMCVVADCFTLNVASGKGKRLGEVAYGLGVFSDLSDGVSPANLQIKSDLRKNESGDTIHFSDVSAIHEIVIGSCESSKFLELNGAHGNARSISMSRFKTDPVNGLCKSSLKSTMAFCLIVRGCEADESTQTYMVSSDRVDLAREVLNIENYPVEGRVFSARFDYGEVLHVRLRKCSINGEAHYNTPLLNATIRSTSDREAIGVAETNDDDDLEKSVAEINAAKRASQDDVAINALS